MMAQKRVERGQWVGQTRSLYCPFLTPLISWHWGRRKERRVREAEGRSTGWKGTGDRTGGGGQQEKWENWGERMEEEVEKMTVLYDLRQQMENNWGGSPSESSGSGAGRSVTATVTAHLTQKHAVWLKLTHRHTHFNITKQMLSQAVINALRCSIQLHRSPSVLFTITWIINVPSAITTTSKCLHKQSNAVERLLGSRTMNMVLYIEILCQCRICDFWHISIPVSLEMILGFSSFSHYLFVCLKNTTEMFGNIFEP